MILARCESNGLYWLSHPTRVCSLTIDPLTLHAQLGHPSLAKLQKMVPNLSKLSALSCESHEWFYILTRLDISFAVSVVSQFLNSPCEGHWDAVIRILNYVKGAPGKGLIYEVKGIPT